MRRGPPVRSRGAFAGRFVPALGDELVHKAPFASGSSQLLLHLSQQVSAELEHYAPAVDSGGELVSRFDAELAAHRGGQDEPSLGPDSKRVCHSSFSLPGFSDRATSAQQCHLQGQADLSSLTQRRSPLLGKPSSAVGRKRTSSSSARYAAIVVGGAASLDLGHDMVCVRTDLGANVVPGVLCFAAVGRAGVLENDLVLLGESR